MYIVKMTAGSEKDLRQTKNGEGISLCGKYKFVYGDVEEADVWVVRNRYVKKSLSCNVAPENTVLMTSEPKQIVPFTKSYIKQFGVVCSCQPDMKGENVRMAMPNLPWFVGIDFKDGKVTYTKTYDDLKSCCVPEKRKLISVITSNKNHTKGHHDRLAFVEKLKKHYGDKIDVFGRGFNSFGDKWDVLAPYKYHIAIENSQADYYLTEKLTDCYITNTYPIYYGCTNAEKFFPKEAFLSIDINNAEEAIRKIDALIASETFENSGDVLALCKDKVLDEYNMYEQIARVCDTLDLTRPKERVTLKPMSKMFNWERIKREIFSRNYWKIRSALGI
jgi:hypothetical protein